jgi:hypothetical protein
MSNKEFWLKLLSENDTALASVIILAERFVKTELSEIEVLYINDKRKWLYEDAPKEKIGLFN